MDLGVLTPLFPRGFMAHTKRLVYCLHRIAGDNTGHMNQMILSRVIGADLPSRQRCAGQRGSGLGGIPASRECDASTIVYADTPRDPWQREQLNVVWRRGGRAAEKCQTIILSSAALE